MYKMKDENFFRLFWLGYFAVIALMASWAF